MKQLIKTNKATIIFWLSALAMISFVVAFGDMKG
jgi:hypothetical protein